jgi:hypothetical protein
MSIAGEDDPSAVGRDGWVEMLRESGFRPQARQLDRDIERIVEASRQMLGVARAEGWHRPLLDSIHSVVEERAAQLTAS